MKRAGVILLLSFVVLVFGFQNCANPEVNFKAIEQKTVDGNSVPGTIQNIDDETVDPLTQEEQGEVMPSVNPLEGQTPTQIDTRPSEQPVNFAGCKSFVEITNTDDVIVPARTNEGVCYYIQLMQEIALHRSGSLGEQLALDVFARPHSKVATEPYVLADVNIMKLTLMGERKVALSSRLDDPNAEMFIDNFFLLEQITANGSLHKWAYGTEDAKPQDGPILVENFEVKDFRSYAPGGTAKVAAIDMSGAVKAGSAVSLRFRALDCGGSAQASDVFLVFH